MDLTFAMEDPRTPDVAELLARHLAFAHETTPLCHVYALDLEGLCAPGVSLCTIRKARAVVAVGAIRHLDEKHCELKSMHVRADERGSGLGAVLLGHLLDAARERGYEQVSLETGTMDAFAPARRLYDRAGFRPCPPFGEYTANEDSVCMTLPMR